MIRLVNRTRGGEEEQRLFRQGNTEFDRSLRLGFRAIRTGYRRTSRREKEIKNSTTKTDKTQEDVKIRPVVSVLGVCTGKS